MLLPNLYEYSDYRLYLKDAYALNKAKQPSFSFRYLALRGGINSSAFFKYVFDGKRNLTKGTMLKTCLAFGIKDKEAEYFEHLVFFNQAKTIKEKNLYFDKLAKLRGHFDVKKLEEGQFTYYSQWYHCVIRELLAMAGPVGDPKTLAHSLLPPITPKQAQESLDLLLRLELIHKDAQGKWKQKDPILATLNPMASQIVIQFQLKMLDLAREAYDRCASEERLMSSTTLAVSGQSVDLFKKKIRQFRAELLELARVEEKPERVYQLNLNFFPTSRKIRG